MSRIGQFFEQLSSHGPRICVDGDGPAYTYAQVLEESERWQMRFDELNVAAGTVVGVHADYSFSSIAALLALFARHAVAAFIPRDGDTSSHLRGALVDALLELAVDGSYHWHRLMHSESHPLMERLRVAGEGGIVIFTSGSTGPPKAALQSLERFLYKFRRPGRRFRTLAFLLLDHVAGLDTLFYTLSSGGTLILTRRRDPNAIVELIESHGVEVLPCSPSFLRMLCAAGNCGEHDLSSLKIITYGSELMDPSTLARLTRRFPGVEISQKYCTTETGSPRSVSRGNDSLWLKIKSNDVETKVVDDVLWIRGEAVILGYLNAPSPIDDRGWYCTGDLVDVEGEWMKFRGRVVDVINVGGQKVAPAEVEQSILELDFVRNAVVSGESHALMGEIVTARVALSTAVSNPKDAIQRIRAHCRQRLASYKVPIKVHIVAGGLVNERQKAQRHRISDR